MIVYNYISLMDSYKHKISLGYVCNAISLIRRSGGKFNKESLIFDRIGTPMWAVTELFKNNFANLFSAENIVEKPLFDDSDDTFLVDTLYNIRLHKQYKDLLESYCKKLLTRKDRLLAKLETGESVLFVRCEEPLSYPDLGNRILAPYEDKYANDEYHHLVEFSRFIKGQYPDLEFKILFMSQRGCFVDEENNIVGITVCDASYKDCRISRCMLNHVSKPDNKAFIKEHL